jgi:hypothetical protein
MGDGRKGMWLGLPIIEPTCLGLCSDLLRISDLGLDRPRTRARPSLFLQKNPAYSAYMQRVRWRGVPGLI